MEKISLSASPAVPSQDFYWTHTLGRSKAAPSHYATSSLGSSRRLVGLTRFLDGLDNPFIDGPDKPGALGGYDGLAREPYK